MKKFFSSDALGLPSDKISKCMGDPEADVDNDVLRTEQLLQVQHTCLAKVLSLDFDRQPIFV